MRAKKLSVLLISATMSLSCAFGAGCSFGNTHTSHTYKLDSDETNHWQYCTQCDEKTEPKPHEDTDGDGRCDTCGKLSDSPAPTVSATGIEISGEAETVEVGKSITFTATLTPANATGTVVWSTSDGDTATVNQSGIVTGKSAGTVTVTATVQGTDIKDEKTVTVTAATPPATNPPEEGITVSGVTVKGPDEVEAGKSITLTATLTPANATGTVVWSTSDEDTATVSGGTVTGVAAGTVTITATVQGTNIKDEKTITVKAAQSTTPPAPSKIAVESVTLSGSKSFILEVGDTETLTATVLPANATNAEVSWSSSDGTIVKVENGKLTALKTGTVTVTATADGVSDKCNVTVEPKTVAVESVTLDVTSLQMRVGETSDLQATVLPDNATNKTVQWTTSDGNTVSVVNGKLTAEGVGKATVTAFVGDVKATCEVTVTAASSGVTDSKITYAHAGNESAAFEWSDSNAAGAKVEYKLSTESKYTTVDAALIRQTSETVSRVDIVGLAGGKNYDFKFTASDGSTFYSEDVSIAAYDRSGYAHFKYTDGVGAYKDDGTPKDNAVIVYVNEQNKNTVTANGQTGLVNILKNAGTSKPLIVRIIGTVGAATWNKLVENGDSALTPDKVLASDGKTKLIDKYKITVGETGSTNITQDTLLKDGMNTLNYYPEAYNGAKCDELKNLNSKIKYDSSKKEFDSCWNDCSIEGVKNVTVEGIGEDARIFQWGMTFKNSDSIEVRNLTFEDYTEDACSFEGGDTSAASLSGFNHGNIWVHHNTFEEGMNYWDVCNEQDKHDGDGSTDFKGLKNITISYNVYNGTHKTGLIGGSNSQTTASVTFHHNAYNGCKARLPLARQANMHMYNNYYNGTTSCDLSLRANAYALVENCYFESGNNRPVELQYDSKYGNGWAKLIGCQVTESNINVASGVNKLTNLYIGSDRAKQLNTSNTYGANFDTDADIFYYKYKNGKSDVTEMLTADQTKVIVPLVAGVMKRSSNITGGGTSGGNSGNEGGNTGNEGGETTETKTVKVCEDFTALNGKAAYDIALSGEAAGYLVGNKIAATKPGGTMALSSKALKLQAATKLDFTTGDKAIIIVITLVNATDKSNQFNLTANGGSAATYTADSNYNVTIELAANTSYQIGRASAEALIAAISLVVPK